MGLYESKYIIYTNRFACVYAIINPNYSTLHIIIYSALIVSASTPIWLDGLRCNGSESRLENCPRNPIGDHNCDRSDDVGLVCAISE